jgi:hypothetical protein
MTTPTVGQKFLITTDEWFFAPDGESYKAVFGTVRALLSDSEVLGIKTNAKSTNWYVHIGNMFVAGCQVHYATQTDAVCLRPSHIDVEHNGHLSTQQVGTSRVYDADRDAI